MSPDRRSHSGPAEESGAEESGIFSRLPDARPARRSPRRRAGDQAPTEPDEGTGKAKDEDRPPVEEREPVAPRPGGVEGGTAPEREGSVEDLAWAGIAVAAEAATLGVRLLSRAVEAVRKPPDRR
jgi:hypothetical protein